MKNAPRLVITVLALAALASWCLLASGQTTKVQGKNKTPPTVGANAPFTNSILALVSPDGRRVYVVGGNEEKALELAKHRQKEPTKPKVKKYSSPQKLYRAVKGMPVVLDLTLYVTNAGCLPRFNYYANCTKIEGDPTVWRKDVYSKPNICLPDGSTNVCVEVWKEVGKSYVYLKEDSCTNGITHADRTDTINDFTCSDGK